MKRRENSILEEVNSIDKNEIGFSIGIGNNAIDSYLALKYAKVSGVDCAIYYHDNKFLIYNKNSKDNIK